MLYSCLHWRALEAQEFRSSLSGGELLKKCRHAVDILNEDRQGVPADIAAESAYCAGFVEAAAEAGSLLGTLDVAIRPSNTARAQRSIRNCAGPEVDGEELVRIVVQLLESTPGSSEQSAVAVSMLAIARAYPCDIKA